MCEVVCSDVASNQLARGGGWDAQSHSTQAVVAALNQASAVMLRRGDLASADLLLRRAHALLPPAGTSAGDTTGCTEGETDGEGNAGLQRQLAVALNNSGCLHRRAGRYDEALNCLEQALAINKALQARARAARASGGGHIGGNASAVLMNMSSVFAACGHWNDALQRAQEAVACVWSFETHWQSPRERMYMTVASYHNLALAQRMLSMPDTAATSLSLALSASEHFFGQGSSMSERVRASALRYAPELKVSLLDYAQWVSACMTLEFSVAPGSAPDVQGRGVGQDQGAAVQDAVGTLAGDVAGAQLLAFPLMALSPARDVLGKEDAETSADVGEADVSDPMLANDSDADLVEPGKVTAGVGSEVELQAEDCNAVLSAQLKIMSDEEAREALVAKPARSREQVSNALGRAAWLAMSWVQRLAAVETFVQENIGWTGQRRQVKEEAVVDATQAWRGDAEMSAALVRQGTSTSPGAGESQTGPICSTPLSPPKDLSTLYKSPGDRHGDRHQAPTQMSAGAPLSDKQLSATADLQDPSPVADQDTTLHTRKKLKLSAEFRASPRRAMAVTAPHRQPPRRERKDCERALRPQRRWIVDAEHNVSWGGGGGTGMNGVAMPSTPTGLKGGPEGRPVVGGGRRCKFDVDALVSHSRQARRVAWRSQGFATPKTKDRVKDWIRVHVPLGLGLPAQSCSDCLAGLCWKHGDVSMREAPGGMDADEGYQGQDAGSSEDERLAADETDDVLTPLKCIVCVGAKPRTGGLDAQAGPEGEVAAASPDEDEGVCGREEELGEAGGVVDLREEVDFWEVGSEEMSIARSSGSEQGREMPAMYRGGAEASFMISRHCEVDESEGGGCDWEKGSVDSGESTSTSPDLGIDEMPSFFHSRTVGIGKRLSAPAPLLPCSLPPSPSLDTPSSNTAFNSPADGLSRKRVSAGNSEVSAQSTLPANDLAPSPPSSLLPKALWSGGGAYRAGGTSLEAGPTAVSETQGERGAGQARAKGPSPRLKRLRGLNLVIGANQGALQV